MRVIVAYDIAEDRRRAQVAARLSSWGDRIQNSVFECRVDLDEFADLVATIESIVDPAVDVVQMFRQCDGCHSARTDIGQARALSDQLFWVV